MDLNHETVRALRTALGLTITDLSRSAGIDRSALSRIESGDVKATPAQVRKLAGALRCNVTAITHRPAA